MTHTLISKLTIDNRFRHFWPGQSFFSFLHYKLAIIIKTNPVECRTQTITKLEYESKLGHRWFYRTSIYLKHFVYDSNTINEKETKSAQLSPYTTKFYGVRFNLIGKLTDTIIIICILQDDQYLNVWTQKQATTLFIYCSYNRHIFLHLFFELKMCCNLQMTTFWPVI